MTSQNPPAKITVGIRDLAIEEELKNAYLTYSMSVIVSRAIPDARDGMKPVQRRILYSMHEQGLRSNTKYRKCAKVVGDVIGNYHPHGDVAVYDTLARMAQKFSMRYTLVDGQGNFGSIDGDPPAAYRYTECKMQRICDEMLTDLDKDTVDFQDNFDGERQEPLVLPAKLPMLLMNGAVGIAVGMATTILPHNLKELLQATIALLDNPEITSREMMKYVKGPDFPTGGIICGVDGIRQAYETGKGYVIVRARCNIETSGSSGKRQSIVVTEIPYQLDKATLKERITGVVREGKITGITNIHDYSNRNGIRLVLELRSGENANVILNQLYKMTPLQSRISINHIALVRGRPETLGLKQMLECYRDHRMEVIRRRTKFLLRRAEARAHIVEGLIKALDHIDRIIEIIRNSPDVPQAQAQLKEEFGLTDIQAQHILDMQLRRLTGLERQRLESELAELKAKIAEFNEILSNPTIIHNMIKSDCNEMIEKYGDERATTITAAADDITIEDLIADEEMAVIITHDGYIKRMSLDSYRRQGRGGKGVSGAAIRDEDFIEHFFIGSTLDYILFFTNRGQIHWLKVYDVPQMMRSAKGRSIANVLELADGEQISALIPVRTFDDEHFLVMATARGIIKKTPLSQYNQPRKGGIRAVNLDEGDELIGVVITNGNNELILASRAGVACRFAESDVRSMGRATRGVIGMDLMQEDRCIGLMVVSPQCTVLTVSELGMAKRSQFEDYRLTRRGAKGVINMRITEKTGLVVSCMTVMETDEVMVITSAGQVIRTSVNGCRVIGRDTQGVKIIRLDDIDKVVAVARLAVSGDEAEIPSNIVSAELPGNVNKDIQPSLSEQTSLPEQPSEEPPATDS